MESATGNISLLIGASNITTPKPTSSNNSKFINFDIDKFSGYKQNQLLQSVDCVFFFSLSRCSLPFFYVSSLARSKCTLSDSTANCEKYFITLSSSATYSDNVSQKTHKLKQETGLEFIHCQTCFVCVKDGFSTCRTMLLSRM